MSVLPLWADEPEDRARWLALWESSPLREPFAHPAYAEAFAPAGERPFALVGEGALFPLLHREVSSGEVSGGEISGGADLSSPYGYGGPFLLGGSAGQDFWPVALAWMRAEGYASLFARLSLSSKKLAPLPSEEVHPVQPNVVRTLDLDPEAMFADYDHKVRKNVKRALRNGLGVEFDETGAELDRFTEIYLATMERNGASAYYRFDRDLFTRFVGEMPGAFLFVHVRKAGRIVSTELVLRSRRTLYSFLGGTDADAFEDRPNDLLKHETILWGAREGYREYVLGGGVATPENGGEDGIFRYKLAFAPHGRRDFSVLRAVVNGETYARLLAARGESVIPRPGFFPAYRE